MKTAILWLKIIGALALAALPLLLLAGCQTTPTVPLELPQPRYSQATPR